MSAFIPTEKGFYWVRYRKVSEPAVGYWDGNSWLMPGEETRYESSDFDIVMLNPLPVPLIMLSQTMGVLEDNTPVPVKRSG